MKRKRLSRCRICRERKKLGQHRVCLECGKDMAAALIRYEVKEEAALTEALASVALDKGGGVHTCSIYCENPACVKRREKEKP